MNGEFIRYCPKCGRKAEKCTVPLFDFIGYGVSLRRFDACYLLCGSCWIVCLDKSLIQKQVSNWRKTSSKQGKKELSHSAMYRKVLEILEKSIKKHRIDYLKYKRVPRFNKKPSK